MFRKIKVATIFLALSAFTPINEPGEILLWPKGAPGSEGKAGAEKVRITDAGEHVISSINFPSITPFFPAREKNTGAVVIIAPGGGHRELWIDHEGYNPGRWLSERGITAVILKYRLAREENSTYTVEQHALADIQRAIRMVRTRAKEWGINPSRVGVMGFSAGGELAGLAAMQEGKGDPTAADVIDRENAHPDFQILIYPGGLAKLDVNSFSSPLFLLGGYGDRADIAEGLAQLYLKYKKANIPAELHIYSKAGHGFGMRKSNTGSVGEWMERLADWMSDQGFTKPSESK